jgi:hypothetical protein
MTTKQTKTKKRPMTLEDFTLAIETDLQASRKEMREGFAAVRGEVNTIHETMATKKDFDRFATKEDLDTAFSTLGDRIATAKEDLQEQIAGLKYAKEIDELRSRVNTLEHKVGIRPSRHAA